MQESEPELSLGAIRNIIVQEFEKTELEFKQFKIEMCKTLEKVETKFDAKLSSIAQKIDFVRGVPNRKLSKERKK